MSAFHDGYMFKAAADDPKELAFAHAWRRLRQHEGYRPEVYIAPEGNLTVGTGINLAAQGPTLRKQLGKTRYAEIQAGKPMTRNEDYRFARAHMSKAYDRLGKIFPSWQKLPPQTQAALMDMQFNAGEGLFGPNLKRFVARKQWPQAAGEIALGHKAGVSPESPEGFRGLVSRRQRNAQDFAQGLGVKVNIPTGKPVDMKKLYTQYMQQFKKKAQ